ncbi:ankyrin repeat domain-containing protein [Chloroflexi bacterium TSY]|nr:ankyrin repeat domain-containing protein [Chloroflexi bacterium TSY]
MSTDVQALLSAALNGDIQTVKRLVEHDPNLIHSRNPEGATPLSMAAGGHIEIVKYLLDQGADITAVGQDGTALHIAAWYGQLDIAALLLDVGIDPNATSESGETALMAAGYKNFVELGRLLIERGADVNAQTTQGTTDMFNTSPPVVGESALHLAAAYGNREFVELLLARGADRSVEDHIGQKPIHWAARHRQDDLFDLLR